MDLLLDTQCLIWFVEGDNHVPARFRALIEDKSNRIYLSIASLWEITIKTSIGKLSPKNSIEELANSRTFKSYVAIIPIAIPHLLALQRLPHHHRDPFDRIIIAQSIVENLTVVTTDAQFDKYSIQIAR